MPDNVETMGPRANAEDGLHPRPTYEFVIHSVRQRSDPDKPDLVLRRSAPERPLQEAKEEITIIVREIGAGKTEKKALDVDSKETRLGADWVADYVESLSGDVNDEVARVVESIIAEEASAPPVALLPPSRGSFTLHTGQPERDAPGPAPHTPPPEPPPADSANRYTKRVEYDRS